MRIIIKTRRVRLTGDVKSQIPKKFLKFEKWIPESTIVELVILDERGAKGGRDKKAILNVDLPHYKMIHLEEIAEDVMAAIDGIQKRLEIKLRKFRDMRLGYRKRDKVLHKMKEALVFFPKKITGKKIKAKTPRIVKRKKFDIEKPMTEKEAIEQMKLLGHSFFIFKSAKTGKMSVIYQRKDGDYGLIECN